MKAEAAVIETLRFFNRLGKKKPRVYQVQDILNHASASYDRDQLKSSILLLEKNGQIQVTRDEAPFRGWWLEPS